MFGVANIQYPILLMTHVQISRVPKDIICFLPLKMFRNISITSTRLNYLLGPSVLVS